ncbi:MAG: membrane protein insertion efficiency factor YidD [Kiritimatiellae bacterium]|nr:membrane protein insertion efficiency factor YidD [Kiritimatiellia bacterium]
MKYIAIFLIRFYQACLSPIMGGNCCRFTPSCSEYMLQAIKKYGFFKGTYLGIRRLLKCHPFHPGGHDPVP